MRIPFKSERVYETNDGTLNLQGIRELGLSTVQGGEWSSVRGVESLPDPSVQSVEVKGSQSTGSGIVYPLGFL